MAGEGRGGGVGGEGGGGGGEGWGEAVVLLLWTGRLAGVFVTCS